MLYKLIKEGRKVDFELLHFENVKIFDKLKEENNKDI